MDKTEHADVSRRLALAIGYRPNDVELVYGCRCAVRHGAGPTGSGTHWYTFDYRDPRIIWPIAERYNAFPRASMTLNGVFWFARVRGPVCAPSLELSKGETASMAVAFAIIHAKGL